MKLKDYFGIKSRISGWVLRKELQWACRPKMNEDWVYAITCVFCATSMAILLFLFVLIIYAYSIGAW